MKTLQEFENFFNGEMAVPLGLLDVRRRKMVNRTLLIWGTALFIIALLIYLMSILANHSEGESQLLLPGLGMGVILVSAIVSWTRLARDRHFYADFKQQVIGAIVRFISPSLVYEPKNSIGLDTFQRSRIFLQGIDRYRGDDMVHGAIDKTQVWFSELKAEYKSTTTNSKGRTKTTWHTIFKGLFFVADFNKHFQTSTIVVPNRLGKGFLSDFLKKLNFTRREKLVNLEDPEFNRHFVVYGNDQIEARYVLSTSLMQRITAFRKKYPNPLYLSFVNSFLYVAIAYRRDLFEPTWFRSLNRFSLVKTYFEDISLAVGIVEELNLNTRIWGKQ